MEASVRRLSATGGAEDLVNEELPLDPGVSSAVHLGIEPVWMTIWVRWAPSAMGLGGLLDEPE